MSLDKARMTHDLSALVGTLSPDVDENKLSVRLEEVLSNYTIERKSYQEMEKDLEENVRIFLAAKEVEGLSPLTLGGYELELRLFRQHINKATALITPTDIRGYLASNREWMQSTVGRKLSMLKSFFSWLVEEEIILRDPTRKIKTPKTPKRMPKGLDISELETVRESCKTVRERAILEVFYSTGCRLNELTNIKRHDLDIQNMSLTVVGKGDKEREVYISHKALFHLQKYLHTRDDNCEYLFTTVRRPIRKICNRQIQRIINKIEERAGITKTLTPHVLRHTYANLSMDAGIELSDLQHLMGHSSPSTTLVYASVSKERQKHA
ncbi:tyrosine-type recombinase/integrase [Sediminibacillus massiliensis]|uniref:tyrosine-type recombinase/integrase n=1 Tax=Sediminibacillus massiliensis TaxID=1926277 RepID=UPI001C4E0580|nr:tyrosine-type recombinase/integrase [Sediminibacillus massiliensis]